MRDCIISSRGRSSHVTRGGAVTDVQELAPHLRLLIHPSNIYHFPTVMYEQMVILQDRNILSR